MIHVENLTKFYDGLCAVDHINFDVNQGEILGLLGPNGAGKTTTLECSPVFSGPPPAKFGQRLHYRRKLPGD